MKEIDTAYLTCPIRQVVARFGDKWSLLVLCCLHKEGTMRFSELNRAMTDISQKMLSATLKNLEQSRLILRRQYPEVPPRVEYCLSELGRSLMPNILGLVAWAKDHFSEVVEG